MAQKFFESVLASRKIISSGRGYKITSVETRTFRPTFEGAQARREQATMNLIGRRNARRDRRANRAI